MIGSMSMSYVCSPTACPGPERNNMAHMPEYVIALVLVVAVAAAAAIARRLTDNDGGPRPEPLPRLHEQWHPGLPSHPYAASH